MENVGHIKGYQAESFVMVVNQPQGLGRYSPGLNTSFEWYLKNHLGSTMLVYSSGSGTEEVKAAYAYRSFGERIALVQSSDKVTEEFTGKELDEETQLNEFGARKYDAQLGVWISVDPARQFASPYVYAGNNTNPISGVDPDGEKFVVQGTPRFQAEVQKAFAQMQATPTGKALYDELDASDRTINIIPTRGGNEALRLYEKSGWNLLKRALGLKVEGDAVISWNDSKRTGGKNVQGSTIRPPFVGLAHELGHAWDYIVGLFRSGPDIDVNGAPAPVGETKSLEVENAVRRESAIPERVGY